MIFLSVFMLSLAMYRLIHGPLFYDTAKKIEEATEEERKSQAASGCLVLLWGLVLIFVELGWIFLAYDFAPRLAVAYFLFDMATLFVQLARNEKPLLPRHSAWNVVRCCVDVIFAGYMVYILI